MGTENKNRNVKPPPPPSPTARRSAADLIAAATARKLTPMPPPEACTQLLELCRRNDTMGATGRGRVGRDEVIRWLREDYSWSGMNHDALDSVCRRLGRTSYTKP